VAQLGRYQIERLLAKGGMAEVFLGRAEGPAGFAKDVVIKRIRPQFSLEPTFVEMFLDEARLAALLNHPNIAQVFDFGQDRGDYFIAMEYIEGESLRTLHRHFMAEKRLIPQRFVLQILIGACEGLHYAHQLADPNGASHNIVHRDISPDNILVSLTGTAKVVDFGIAKAASSTSQQTQAGILKGKRSYVSPEQILGERLDRRIDVYALGVTLFELLTGRRPFVADSDDALLHVILEEPTPEASKVNAEVPEPLSKIVAKAMARNREERYQNARGLQTALEEIQAASGKKMTSAGLTQLVAGVSAARKRPSRAPKALPDAQQLPIPSAADDVSAPLPTDPGPPFFGPTAPEPPATFEDTTEKLALPLRPDPPNPTLEQPQSVALDERTIVEQRPEPTGSTVSERQISRGDLEQASVPAEPPTRGPLRAVVLAFVIGGCIAAAALGVWLTRRQPPATVPTATTAEP
jgi:serine/threonine-protein kinase